MSDQSLYQQLQAVPPWERLNLLWEAHLKGQLDTDDDPSWAVRYGYISDPSPMRRIKAWYELIFEYGLRMTKDEEAILAKLPDQITVYRGYCADNGFKEGFSWTIDKSVAEQFATGHGFKNPELFTKPAVVERVLQKAEVIAYIKGEEDEVIILPPSDELDGGIQESNFL